MYTHGYHFWLLSGAAVAKVRAIGGKHNSRILKLNFTNIWHLIISFKFLLKLTQLYESIMIFLCVYYCCCCCYLAGTYICIHCSWYCSRSKWTWSNQLSQTELRRQPGTFCTRTAHPSVVDPGGPLLSKRMCLMYAMHHSIYNGIEEDIFLSVAIQSPHERIF